MNVENGENAEIHSTCNRLTEDVLATHISKNRAQLRCRVHGQDMALPDSNNKITTIRETGVGFTSVKARL